MSVRSWIRNLFAGKASKSHVSADRRGLSRKPRRTLLCLEGLETRLAPAFTSFSGGILTVDLNNASEEATLSNDGANISLTSSNAITGAGASFSTASVTKLVVTDAGNNAFQAITFAGTTAYSLSGGLDSSGVETNIFNDAVTATGAASLSVTAPQNIVVSKNLTGGTGGTTLQGNGATFTVGVKVQSGAVVTATGSGNVTVTGTGTYGVNVTDSGSMITSGGGAVQVTGQGHGPSNAGVRVYSSATITAGGSGTVTVTGTGGANASNSNYGVFVASAGTITSGGGAVQVTGHGGGGPGTAGFFVSGSANYGVSVTNNSMISVGGSGTVTVQGTGDSTRGGFNYGVNVSDYSLIGSSSSGGAVLVTGQGGSSDSTSGGFNYGVNVSDHGGIESSSSGGAVLVTGQGGSGGPHDHGVVVANVSGIYAFGSGTATVQGTGGSGIDNNFGVYVTGLADEIGSSGGAVLVTGQGGGNFGGNVGVVVDGSIYMVAGGTMTVQGTGGSGSGGFNYGVEVSGLLQNVSAALVTGQGGDSTNNTAFLQIGTIDAEANITVRGDSMDLASGLLNAGSNTVTLTQLTPGTAINLGGADAAGTLGLTNAEVNTVTAGTLQIGDANSGAINVSTDITRPASTAMVLTSGGDVVISGGQVNTGGGTLLLHPGTSPAAVKPTKAGVDATASTVSLAGPLNINIAGTTVDSGYTQLNVSGTVDLTGVDLLLTGGYVPVNGDAFTIVSATNLTSTFNGLPDGAHVTFNGESLRVNYTPTTVTLTAPATPSLTWSNPADITYGTALGATQLDTTANVAGTFTYTPAAGTVLNAGPSQSLSVLFTPDDIIDYTTVSTTVTVNVAQATPTVGVDPVNIIYGTTLADSQLSGTVSYVVGGNPVSVAGVFTYTSAAGTALGAGNGQIENVTFTPTDSTDYTTASTTITVNVAQAALTVTADNQSKVYGAADPTLTYTPSGTFFNGDSYSVISGVTLSTDTGGAATAGTHTITATGGTAANYAITFVSGTLTVSQAALTVTADNQSKVYGAADPALTYTASGTLYYGDRYSVISGVTLSTTTGGAATAGTHTITATGGTAANYAITDVNGTLTVAKAAALTATADNQSKGYGAADPTLTYTPSGTLYYGDTYSVISGVTLSTTTGAAATAGTHTITASGGTADNYNVVDANGTLTVSQATLIVTADNQSKVYGAADPSLTYTVTGATYYGDSYSVISGVTLSTTTGAAATAGTHTIAAAGGTAANYKITDANGTLTVTAATPTVTISDTGGTYNGSPFSATATVNGGASLEGVSPTITYYAGSTASGTLLSGAPSNAGTYTAVAAFAGSADYTNASAQTTFTISQTTAPGVTLVGTEVYVLGGKTTNDQVQVTPVGTSTTGSTGVKVQATLNGVQTTTTFNQAVTALHIHGYSGNDNIQLANSLTVNASISAGDGNDNIQAGGGNITVALGNGNDNVQLGSGDNSVTTGNGNDNVQLGDGNNVVVTGTGNDNIQAGNGANLIAAGLGQHNVQVGNGRNILIDGSVALTTSGDSLRQVLNDWVTYGATDAASIRSRLAVTYNTSHANNFKAGSGLDWFWETYAGDSTNRKATDQLN